MTHGSLQSAAQRIGKTKGYQQRGENKKGEQGGENRAVAEGETFLHCKGDLRGKEQDAACGKG